MRLGIVRHMRRPDILTYFIVAFCIFPIEALAQPCRVNIGLVLPLTGNAASYGERAQRGAFIAQEATRDMCEVSLKFGDSKFESASGLSAYRSLAQASSIDAVITGSSQVSIPIREVATRDGVLQIAIFTSSSSFSKPEGSSFRICPSSSEEVTPLVDLVTKTPRAVAGAIFLANDFGESVASDFKIQLERKGAKLATFERILPGSSDFRSEMLRLKKAGVTHLLAIGLPFQYLLMFRTAHELKFEPQFLTMRIIEDEVVKQAGLSYGRVVYSYPFDELSPDPNIVGFVRSYREQFKSTPDAYGAEAFEAVRLIAKAAARCQKDLACASKFLRSQSFATVFGEISFNSSGDSSHSLFLKTIAGASFARFVPN